MAYYITNSKIRGDIYTYRRMKAKNITQKHDVKCEELVEKAQIILNGYAENSIAVRNNDKKVFAEYIDTFGFANRENLLQKLQKESSFNVKQYLEENRRTWWQKMFSLKPSEPKSLTAAQMEKRIRAYKALGKTLSRGWFHKDGQYNQQLRLEKEAESYAANFLKGKIRLYQNDVPTAVQYLSALGDSHNGSVTLEAVKQIKATPIENFEKAESESRFASVWANLKNKFNSLRNSATTPAPVLKPIPARTRHNLWIATKAAGLTFLLSAATMFAFKSDKGTIEKKSNSSEIKATPKKDVSTASTKVLQPVQQSAELTHEQKIWQNFYQTKNDIIASSLNLDAAALQNTLQQQAEKGIFSMPENTNDAQIIYTHLMYKAYGLESPIDAALNGTQKISVQQQKDIEQAIQTAGHNGIGVKKIAQKIAAKHGRKLGRYSAYDHASKQKQKMYVTNLKQIRALNR